MGRVTPDMQFDLTATSLVCQVDHLFQRPHMICHTCRHCGGHTQRLVNAAEVVVHEVQTDCMHVVLDFLAEAIGQPSESPHVHAHRQVLALHEAC